MPRWASRISLEVTEIAVQRIQDILTRDAVAEGAPSYALEDYFTQDAIDAMKAAAGRFVIAPPSKSDAPSSTKVWFRELWDELNAGRGYGWDANPWVWVVRFRRVEN